AKFLVSVDSPAPCRCWCDVAVAFEGVRLLAAFLVAGISFPLATRGCSLVLTSACCAAGALPLRPYLITTTRPIANRRTASAGTRPLRLFQVVRIAPLEIDRVS